MKAYVERFIVDSNDPVKSSAFWTSLLHCTPPAVVPGASIEQGPRPAFRRSPPAVMRRVLEVRVNRLEVATVLAVRLGATAVGPIGSSGTHRYRDMCDPGGSTFRLLEH